MTIKIENQVKLPMRIALGVVLQGIRIRFGRSLVTLSGVALGVAFLMSIFTGQVVKRGVRHEEDLRNETGRMYGFLTVEVGPAADRTVDVVQVGPLSELELRLIAKLRDQDVGAIRWVALNGAAPPPGVGPIQSSDAAALGAGSIGIIAMGEAPENASAWTQAINPGTTPVITTRTSLVPIGGDLSVSSLVRELRPEEIANAAADKHQQRVRSVWIITISLLVTVIGISNAMLMSVTERFREIGTMKCLGALSAFIRRIFLIESSLMGLMGSVIGGLVGMIVGVPIPVVGQLVAAVFFAGVGALVGAMLGEQWKGRLCRVHRNLRAVGDYGSWVWPLQFVLASKRY